MAILGQYNSAEIGRVLQAAYVSQSMQVLLCNVPGLLTAASPIEQWVALEISGNGYTRQSRTILIGDLGSYNGTTGQWEMAPLQFQFSASGGPIGYQSIVAIIGGSTLPWITANAATAVNTADDYIQLGSAVPYGDGTPVTVTIAPGGTLPGGINPGGVQTKYYVKAGSPNTRLELYTNSGLTSKLNITSVGSGTLQIRHCGGTLHSVAIESEYVIIPDGTPRAISVALQGIGF